MQPPTVNDFKTRCGKSTHQLEVDSALGSALELLVLLSDDGEHRPGRARLRELRQGVEVGRHPLDGLHLDVGTPGEEVK